jgi:hypothetical protein
MPPKTKHVELGPWVRGIVNTVDDNAIPNDGLADAKDCDIGADGFAVSRGTYLLVSANDAFRFLFESGGQSYAVSQGYVGVLGETSFTTIYPVVGDVGWTELGGLPVFCDSTGVYQIDGVSATQLVVRPTLEEEGRYDLVSLPGGHAVAYWQGRLLVLRGKSLLWSEPLDYGCHSPARNFVRFPTTPTWMAPLHGGIFVGLRNSVIFLSGTDPAEFRQTTVADQSCPKGVLIVDDPLADANGGGGPVAIWMTGEGFVVGRPDGSVLYPQADNLTGLPIVPRSLAYIDGRIYAFATGE